MKISVCTLAHGRAEHLANLVRGLARSLELPCELIVAVMQTEPYDLPEVGFPVRQLLLDGDRICLAEARNAAAAAASGDLLVFIDVDCIPSPDLLSDYARASRTHDGILMGEVGYLPAGATDDGIDYARFERVAVKHSERAGPPVEAVGPCSDYRCFWSLNFAIPKRTFDELGGFDPRFVGYGGEDTDFGRTAAV